jgi:hypothetical protein
LSQNNSIVATGIRQPSRLSLRVDDWHERFGAVRDVVSPLWQGSDRSLLYMRSALLCRPRREKLRGLSRLFPSGRSQFGADDGDAAAERARCPLVATAKGGRVCASGVLRLPGIDARRVRSLRPVLLRGTFRPQLVLQGVQYGVQCKPLCRWRVSVGIRGNNFAGRPADELSRAASLLAPSPLVLRGESWGEGVSRPSERRNVFRGFGPLTPDPSPPEYPGGYFLPLA